LYGYGETKEKSECWKLPGPTTFLPSPLLVKVDGLFFGMFEHYSTKIQFYLIAVYVPTAEKYIF
jgi:hypothetical protein